MQRDHGHPAPDRTVRKAVIPAAGLGTRFLPATKSVPKEMLPIVDTPAIELVVREAMRAGLEDVLMIVGRTKRALEDYFDRNVELEAALRASGDLTRLALVERSNHMAVSYVRQRDPRGLGHAVLCAAGHVGREPFAVLLADDLVDERDLLLEDMLAVHERTGGCVVALMPVPAGQIHMYGCAAVEATDVAGAVRITGLVEKPAPGTEPSNLAVIGRYVLTPQIFDELRSTPPGRGGEIQLTDAIQRLTDKGLAGGGPVYGVIFEGRRYDTGDRLDYLRTVIRLAVERPDLGPELTEWLRGFVATLPAPDASSAGAAGEEVVR